MNWIIWLLAVFMAVVTGYLYGKTYAEVRGNADISMNGGGRVMHAHGKTGRIIQPGWYLNSPVNGTVEKVENEQLPCLKFVTMEGRVYAPFDGRIVQIFPTGNMMRIENDKGAEVTVGVDIGDRRCDELSDYFRPRVVDNEVVENGKLLMEFDRSAIEREEIEPLVTMRIDSGTYGENGMLHGEEDIIFRGEELIYFGPKPDER